MRHARILAQCRRAMAAGASLLLVERVLPEAMAGDPGERALARSDLNMLVGFSGRSERSPPSKRCLRRPGLAIRSCQPLALGYSLIETR
jgi:hypothetical protein